MADEKGPSGNPMQDLLLFVGFLLVLVVAWFARGGASRADIKGIFLQPPPPISTGDSYGPTPGTVATTTTFHY